MALWAWNLLKRNRRMYVDLMVIALMIWLVMWVGGWMFKLASPIFFGVVIYMAIAPLVRLLTKTKMKRGVATSVALIGTVLVVGGILVAGSFVAVKQIQNVAERLPQYISVLQSVLSSYEEMPYGAAEKINETLSDAGGHVLNVATGTFLTFVGTLSSSLVFVGNLLLGVLLAFFLGKEEERISRVIERHSPPWAKEGWSFLKTYVLQGISRYIKAQCKLMMLTFVLVFVGLFMIGVKNAFVIALLSGVFDLLPLLGVATIFIPWIAYLLITGDTHTALLLGVLYLVVFLVRQFLEPKIVGDSLGVSAFVMLSLMVIFLGIFGVWGLVLTPILTILLKELWVQGYIKKWVRMHEKKTPG